MAQLEVRTEVQQMLTLLAKTIVDDTSAVIVSVSDCHDPIKISLRVAPADLGKVIGKQGRTAQALRILLQAAGMKHKLRFEMDIDEV